MVWAWYMMKSDTRIISKTRAQWKYVLGKIVNNLAKTIVETDSALTSIQLINKKSIYNTKHIPL